MLPIRMIALALICLPALFFNVAQTTTTDCNTNGNYTNCRSTTTAKSTQGAFDKGWENGQAAARRSRFNNYVEKYCAANPGDDWKYSSEELITSGHCPSQEEKKFAVVNTFMSKHKNLIRSAENEQTITDYIKTHNLNPSEEKSYDQAFKELKKQNHLQLYAR